MSARNPFEKEKEFGQELEQDELDLSKLITEDELMALQLQFGDEPEGEKKDLKEQREQKELIERFEKEKAAREKAEREKAAKEKADKERADKEKAAKEKEDKDRIERARTEQANLDYARQLQKEEDARADRLALDQVDVEFVIDDRFAVHDQKAQAELRKKQLAEDIRRKQLADDIKFAQKLNAQMNPTQTENDADLAKAYDFAFQLERKKEDEERARRKQLEQDEEAGRQVAMELERKQRLERGDSLEVEAIAKKFYNIHPKELWEPLAVLEPILQTPAVAGERDRARGAKGRTNAHKFTVTHIRPNLPKGLELDDKYKLSDKSVSLEQIRKEVLDFFQTTKIDIPRANLDNINKSIDLVAKAPGVEASETNAHVTELLSRTWSLAKLCGQPYQGAIISCLSDNIGDGGSCMAGLVARLFPPYMLMLNEIFSMGAGIYESPRSLALD